MHLGVVGEVEEARLLVRIAQVPVGDGTERHEEQSGWTSAPLLSSTVLMGLQSGQTVLWNFCKDLPPVIM